MQTEIYIYIVTKSAVTRVQCDSDADMTSETEYSDWCKPVSVDNPSTVLPGMCGARIIQGC